MFDYHAANDETIIARSHDGDDAATDFLLEKYKPLVKKKARTLFLIGGDNDDLIQEGMIGLYKSGRHRNRQGKCNGHREPHRKAPEQV